MNAIGKITESVYGRANAETDWEAIQETLYVNSIPGMAESILKGRRTPIEDCIPEEEIEW